MGQCEWGCLSDSISAEMSSCCIKCFRPSEAIYSSCCLISSSLSLFLPGLTNSGSDKQSSQERVATSLSVSLFHLCSSRDNGSLWIQQLCRYFYFFLLQNLKRTLASIKKRTCWLKLDQSSQEIFSLGPIGYKAAGKEVRDMPITLESVLASFSGCSSLLHSTNIAELWEESTHFLVLFIKLLN